MGEDVVVTQDDLARIAARLNDGLYVPYEDRRELFRLARIGLLTEERFLKENKPCPSPA